jgi:methionyl-tRNA formyltransferase
VWPVYDGRFEDIGFTTHLVVPKVDSGPVLWQERVDWDPRMSLGQVAGLVTQRMYDKLADIAIELTRGAKLQAEAQANRPVRPPAGLVSRARAEWSRRRYAAGRRGPARG